MKSNMIKQLSAISILIALFLLFQTAAKAQTYALESLDGVKIKLNLCDTIQRGRILAISYLKDTVQTECWDGLKSVKVINKKFLQIVCGDRGGSGLALNATTILAVNKGKLCVCMAVLSYGRGISADWEALFKINFAIAGTQKSNYKIIAHIHDEKIFYRKRQNNHRLNSTIILKFDPVLDIFYTDKKQITKYFEGGDDSGTVVKQKAISGVFPAILLNSEKYYFIQARWYKEGLDNILYLQ